MCLAERLESCGRKTLPLSNWTGVQRLWSGKTSTCWDWKSTREQGLPLSLADEVSPYNSLPKFTLGHRTEIYGDTKEPTIYSSRSAILLFRLNQLFLFFWGEGEESHCSLSLSPMTTHRHWCLLFGFPALESAKHISLIHKFGPHSDLQCLFTRPPVCSRNSSILCFCFLLYKEILGLPDTFIPGKLQKCV